MVNAEVSDYYSHFLTALLFFHHCSFSVSSEPCSQHDSVKPEVRPHYCSAENPPAVSISHTVKAKACSMPYTSLRCPGFNSHALGLRSNHPDFSVHLPRVKKPEGLSARSVIGASAKHSLTQLLASVLSVTFI